MLRKSLVTLTGFVVAGAVVPGSAEAFSLFSDRSIFENQLESFLVDDYSNSGYLAGDGFDGSNFDSHSDTNMSSVFGETQYSSTGFSDNNLIPGQSSGDPFYCAGCNGSFLLDFTSTSVGNSLGVFGVGLDIKGLAEGVFGTVAFVTFGDGSTDNFFLPERVDAFWGITSDLRVSSIHFGLENGATNTDNSVQRMALDNLTIGSGGITTDPEPVPEPTTMLGIGVAGAVVARRKWQQRKQNMEA